MRPSTLARSVAVRQAAAEGRGGLAPSHGIGRGPLCVLAASCGPQVTTEIAAERPHASPGKKPDLDIGTAPDAGPALQRFEEGTCRNLGSGRSDAVLQPGGGVGESCGPARDGPPAPSDGSSQGLGGCSRGGRGTWRSEQGRDGGALPASASAEVEAAASLPSYSRHVRPHVHLHAKQQQPQEQPQQQNRLGDLHLKQSQEQRLEQKLRTAPSPLWSPPAPLPWAPPTVMESPSVESSEREADKALLVAIFRSVSWTQLRDLLQTHQEQHMETTRLAAAAAATAAAASQHQRLPRQQLVESPAAASAEASLPDRRSPGPDRDTSTSAAAHLRQAEQHRPERRPQQSAFTARHLATALHIVSLRVPEPHSLSHADRVQLGEFVGALGRGCVSLASRQAFPPVDLCMALRALAKLLGDSAVESPARASKGLGTSRSIDRWAAESAGATGGGHLDSRDRAQPGEGDVRTDERLDEQYDLWDGANGLPLSYSNPARPGPSSITGGVIGGSGGEAWRRGSNGVADARWASSRGHLHATWLDAGWVDRMLAPTVQGHLQDFEPRHVSGVLWALATLRVRPRPELLIALCERAAECARPAAVTGAPASAPVNAVVSPEAMTPQGLSLTLWSLARLGFKPVEELLDVLLEACEADMRTAAVGTAGAAEPMFDAARSGPNVFSDSPQVKPCCSLDLAQRAWAVASLGCHPGREWLELLVEAFLARGAVEQVSGQSCSMLVWALARLNGLRPRTERPLSAEISSVDGAANQATAVAGAEASSCPNNDDPAEALLARVESGRQASTSGRQEPPARATSRLQTQSKSGLSSAAPPELGSVYSMSGSAARNGVTESWPADAESQLGGVVALQPPGRMTALLTMLRGALDRMSSQHLATVLWALSTLNIRPSEAWLEAFLDAASRRMNAALLKSQPFGPQSLAMMLGALARLRYRPPPGWMQRYMEVCRKELPSFGPHSACVLGWALVRLSYRPRGDWKRAFTARTQRLLPDMPAHGLCLLLWSLASWRYRPPTMWLNTAFAVSARHLRSSADAWERGTAALEAQAATGSGGGDEGSPRLTQPLSQQAELQPELLAVLLWSVSNLLQRPPPMFWLSLADSATYAAMRYSRAVTISRVAPGVAAAASFPASPHHVPATIGPRALAMLLQGWARLGRPPAQGVLSAALSYTIDAADAAVAAGADAAVVPPAPNATAPRVNTAAVCQPAGVDAIEPQHIVMVLWSCAVMGLEPPADSVSRLSRLHSDLLLLKTARVSRSASDAPSDGRSNASSSSRALSPSILIVNAGTRPNSSDGPAMPPSLSAAGESALQSEATRNGLGERQGMDTGIAEGSSSSGPNRLLQMLLARELLARQAELGMLVWALVKLGIDRPPEWLPAVLAAVGRQLELDAVAAASSAAASAGDPGVSPAAESSEGSPFGGSGAASLQGGGAAASVGPAGPGAMSYITLLTVKTLSRACLAWRVYPGERWIAAATACLEAGALGTNVRRVYGRANLEAEVWYLLEQLQTGGGAEGSGSSTEGGARGSPVAALAAAAEAASGAVLTNAVAAVAAGSAAAWMQGLVW